MNPRFASEREKNNKICYQEYVNDYCYPHFHSQIELYFIMDGEMDIMVNSRRKVLKRGELAVSLSLDTHQYKTPEYSRSAVFIIPMYMAGGFELLINKRRAADPFICEASAAEFIRECAGKIVSGGLLELEVQGYINLILGKVYNSISFEQSEKRMGADLSSKILFYLEEHFKEDITLEKLSHSLGYSPFYISHFFKSSYNIGFNSYLSMLRVRNFVRILGENNYNITYCAYESGFNSMRTFYRAFMMEFNMPPTEYIKDKLSSY